MARTEITRLIGRLQARQAAVSAALVELAKHEDLERITPDGFTVRDTLQMWVHEIRSHHRELVLARGRMTGDNPYYHVPHFVRQANEEFGRFVGELSALTDSDLDRTMPGGGSSVREIIEHVQTELDYYFVQRIEAAVKDGQST